MNPKVEWLQYNLIPVRSIDPNDEDFSDLEPLKKVFGKARVVMLGEQSHGDGATFLAKTRLVKFLHQKMGFDVLAFESGLYDCHLAWERIVARDNPEEAIRKALWRVWANSAQTQALMDYLVQAAHGSSPLQLVGFDTQFTNRISKENFAQDFLRAVPSQPSDAVRACLQGLVEWAYYDGPPPDAQTQRSFFRYVRQTRFQLRKEGSFQSRLWDRILAGAVVDARRYWEKWSEAAGGSLRDKEMGRNLRWLLKNIHPNRRVIIWAANTHTGLDYQSASFVGRKKNHGFVPMGWHVRKVLGEKVYSLGFISAEGQRGLYRESPEPLPELKRGDLEYWLHKTLLKAGILNLKKLPEDHWLQRPIIAHPVGHFRMKGVWPQSFDGLFYIRRMTPSTPSSPIEPKS